MDQGTSNVEEFTSNGVFIPPRLKPEGNGEDGLSILENIKLKRSDNLHITDPGEHDIKKYVIVK